MSNEIDNNRQLWDGWTGIHERSEFYDLPAFRAGQNTLKDVELGEVGPVEGRELLHLQCHFGLNTLSWARLGARVTGVDFSERAIGLARSLAEELDIETTFLCSDVRTLPPDWTDRFDIVFTSYGVLPWLPDLAGWATGIARVLRPGGSFHIVEFHPITAMLDDEGKHLSQPYFHTPQAARYEVAGSYADPDASFTHPAFEWAYSLSDVITALIDAGLRIRAFREYPFSPYDCFPYLEEQSAGRWTVRGAQVQLPLLFSIHADRVAP